MSKIAYTDKVAVNVNAGIPDINKVNAADMNEIKTSVNSLYDDPVFANSITGSYLTANEMLITDGSKKIVSAPVATYPSLTELAYLKGATGVVQTQINNLNSGWLPAGETWTYVSTDDPSGTFKVQADVTAKYSIGMRIKLTNGGNIIWGIITKVGTYGGDSAGYTYITYLHEINPSNSLALHLLANSAISANYYSTAKEPFGFPAEINKWTMYYSSTTSVNQATPTINVWYNIDNRKLDIPIGSWLVSYSIPIDDQATAGNTNHAFYTSLSTANNTGNTSLICGTQQQTSTDYMEVSHDSNNLPIILTAKTPYYLNARTALSTCNRLRYGVWKVFRIQAICTYAL